jgi:hypothetical protein
VDTAVTNIRNSLQDPFPSVAKTTAPSVQTLTVRTDAPKAETKKTDPPTTEKASESPSGKKGSDPGTATSKSSATTADVEHPVKHEKKVHDPASTKDGHPDGRPNAKDG